VSISGDDPLFRTAQVYFGGVQREVSLACLPEARPGDWVLVHVGFALSVLDEAAAQQFLSRFAAAEEDDGSEEPGG